MLLNNRYLIQDSIGRSHMTKLYRGIDRHTDHIVVIKVLPMLEEIIMRCLEKSPDMRFRDGSHLASALETLCKQCDEL